MSLAFVLARLYIRRRVIGHFKADDYLVVASWIFYLAVTVTWTILGSSLYTTLDAGTSGSYANAVTAYLKQYAHALNANLGTYVCFWTSLYTIKLSFMVFFHGLGNNLRAQKFLWWGVLGVIAVSYGVTIGLLGYPCLAADWEHIIGKCLPMLAPST